MPIHKRSAADGNYAARHWVVRFLAFCCFGLIPWTIGLAVTLPRTYRVDNWPLAWTGFNVILLGCLTTTAWALWKQRLLAIPASIITSVLLLCDAWFDLLTAHGGRCLIVSIATAAFAELPIAGLLALISVRLLRANLRTAPASRPEIPRGSIQQTPRVQRPPTGWPRPGSGRGPLGAPRPPVPTSRRALG